MSKTKCGCSAVKKIFAEVEEMISDVIDIEEKGLRSAHGRGNTQSYQMHEYAEDILITLRANLRLLRKEYTEEDK